MRLSRGWPAIRTHRKPTTRTSSCTSSCASPFIGLTLNGKTSYRRPGLYHFVFRGVRAAEKFDDLRYDLGDPLSWSQRYTLAVALAEHRRRR